MKKILFLFGFIAAALLVQAQGYQPGDVVEDFRLLNVDGKMVSMADYNDAKAFLVIFTCNHCPYAVAYEDRIIALNSKFKPMGVPVIAINPNDPVVQPADSYDNMKIRAKKKKFNFPYVIDATQEVTKKYGASKTPHVYLVVKEGGKYVLRYIGAIDDNYEDAAAVKTKYVEDAVNAVLDGKAPEVSSTKAIGCTIKWKKS